jgi:hypothetical protein
MEDNRKPDHEGSVMYKKTVERLISGTTWVDEDLEDRDRIWCLALVQALKIDQIHRVLVKYRELRKNEVEILKALHLPV